ncbi:MAG: hypothetical protein COZ17_07950 [Flavobacteriaceae bacterium CG_4_10_14_3_um_filter_33_47]|nr:MAG: hypothetical protein COW44_14015 [Flavobacteriaceae bacterium CG17_big_fil_post_rev_8_21_14_2_50_33_15]PIY11149.1 MAG: hypothetical protein COZ17_07950 [Flavobacteriaceae bacterium CG_4_10_14_3_um_filter_33_47]PJB17834.1 MAG: hypothetical protein CO117_10315 [Flavobacteriaceae bacterium CG_4_9_14_3_um_filter_33_16]
MATSVNLYAQETKEDDAIDILLDELFFNDEQFINDILDSFNTYHFIYTNVSFNSNTFFTGRDSGVDQFNIVPQISYYSASGFNMSVSGIYYESFIPNWDFTNVSLGYYNTIGKNKLFNYNLGYTRYFYANGWDTFTNSIDLSFGVRNKKRTLGTKLATSYLFGTDQSFQLVSRTYANINLAKEKNFNLNFRPQISFTAAQQTTALEQLNTIGDVTTVEYIFNDVFDLLNTQINIPLSLSTKSWDFELGYNINLPSRLKTEPELKSTSFFSISIGYLIDLK